MKKHNTVCLLDLPPTVQNCPNLFCDATRIPVSKVVTFVS